MRYVRMKLGKVGSLVSRVSRSYGENDLCFGERSDELSKERIVMMWMSNFIAVKVHGALQARRFMAVHREHLFVRYDRTIGTRKDTKRLSSLTKNNKQANLYGKGVAAALMFPVMGNGVMTTSQ